MELKSTNEPRQVCNTPGARMGRHWTGIHVCDCKPKLVNPISCINVLCRLPLIISICIHTTILCNCVQYTKCKYHS